VREGEWYLMEPFLNLLNELSEMSNQTPNLVAIGMAVAETAYMPPEMGDPTFENVLMHWDEHYQSNHRAGDIGYKVVEKLEHNLYTATIVGGLYPDDFEYGVLYGFARRFLPEGSYFTIQYDESVPRMDQGGEKTVYVIEYE